MLFVIIAVILSVPLAMFALSNTQIVTLGLWPTDYTIDVHLSLAVLIAMAFAFLIGAVVVWFSELSQRRRARRAERMVRLLEAQVQELKARIAQPVTLPPTS
jgi:putative membrane protein